MKRNIKKDLLDELVVAFDRRQRRKLNIWEFTDDPQCILRVSLARSRWEQQLADGSFIRRDEIIGRAHLWNDRVPPLPVAGPDLRWAREARQRFVHSLRLLAHAALEDPRLIAIRGFGGPAPFSYTAPALAIAERLGFEVYHLPPSLWNTIEGKVSNLWVWLLRRAFNRPSIWGAGSKQLEYRFYWLSREKLLALYGPGSEGHATRNT